MSVITNIDRANKVKKLLGLSGNKESEETDNSYVRVADVLCDLQHYCDKYVIDMNQEKYMADVFYNDEISQEEETNDKH